MTIKTGDKLPPASFKQLTASGMHDITTQDVFGGKKVILFSVPGAFTPTCSVKHMPGFVQNLDKFKAQGITVVCLAVNDPFVMKAWQDTQKAEGITMLPDGNGTFTKALGLEMDGTGYGLGTRAQRFSLYAVDGVVKTLDIEKPGACEISTAEAALERLAA